MSEDPKVEEITSLVDDEFKDRTPVDQPAEQQPAEGFYLDVQIGGQTVRVTGATESEVYEAALAEQERFYNREMLATQLPDLSHEATAFETQPEPWKALDKDGLSALMLQFGTNPTGAVRRLLEENFQMPFERIQKQLYAAEVLEGERQGFIQAEDFMERNPDFYRCDINRDMMLRYMLGKNLDFAKPESYDHAFAQLSRMGVLEQAPEGANEDEQQYVPPMPTAMPGRGSVPVPTAPDGSDVEALKKAYNDMSLEELDALRRASSSAIRGGR